MVKGQEKDLLDCSKEEILEFLELGKKFKKLLIKLFQPDLFNYQSLNNNTKHLHIHMIPRYSTKRDFLGITFIDTDFGKMYIKRKDFTLSEDQLVKMVQEIKKYI